MFPSPQTNVALAFGVRLDSLKSVANLVIISCWPVACSSYLAISVLEASPSSIFLYIPWLASKEVDGVIFSPFNINVWSPFLSLPLLVLSFGSPRVIMPSSNPRSLIIGSMTSSLNFLFLCQGLLAPRCAPEGWKNLMTKTTASNAPCF